MIAGYRVVRKIGAGRRAEVHLGNGAAGSVAIKVFREDAATVSVDTEIAVLTTVEADALPAFLDISTIVHGGVCVVVEHLAGPTLARLLAERRDLRDGELVTVLAPVVVAVAAMHDAGFSLGEMAPRALRFSAEGRPAITSLHAARPLARLTPEDRNAAMRADYAILGRFIDDVTALAEHLPLPVADFLRSAASARPMEHPLPEAERMLFDLAEAAPVEFGGGEVTVPDIPGRLATTNGGAPTATDAARGSGDDGWLSRLADVADRGPLRALAQRLVRFVAKRRRPVIVATALAAAASVAVLLAVPMGATGRVSTEDASSVAMPSATPTSSPAPTKPAPTGEGVGPESGAAGDIGGDDPVAAARALLTARTACLQADSAPGCLDDVDEPGSPIAAADAAGSVSGADPLGVPGNATLVLAGRVGDAAVIALAGDGRPETSSASLLLVRGEAGWRLRDAFVD